VNGTTNWLADRVASLVPNMLPHTSAAASFTFSFCSGCVCFTQDGRLHPQRFLCSGRPGGNIVCSEIGCCTSTICV
jgi:hypothetical protein